MFKEKRKFLAFALFISFLVSSNAVDVEPDKEVGEQLTDYPLPKTLEPQSYDVRITEINFEKSFFSGWVRITANVKKATKEVVLHCGKLLKCRFNSVTPIKGNESEIVKHDQNEITEKISATLKEPLKEGTEVDINLDFSGDLRDDMIGFYRSSYMVHNKESSKERFLASTQFEATRARHAFPCFDEPHLKATFAISLIIPDGYDCLGNMPQKIPKPDAGSKEKNCKFETTKKMPTYLVAFVVSDFTSTKPSGKYAITVWSQDATMDQRDFSVDIAKKSIEYFEKTLGEEYAFPKMDLVAVPDFSAGAMENWGLLTFRESNLLVHPKHTSAVYEQRVATVVAHEIAHMWFGNLVTPETWSYLWLSEGFARYYEYMATDAINKAYKLSDQFVVDQHQSALGYDSVEDSKPMTRIAETTSEIESMGDKICYNKGASVIRMMEHAFGHKVFEAALSTYLKSKKFGSVTPDDLWKAIQDQVNKADPNSTLKVKDIMESWTTNAGYPLITVTESADEITFKQERFYSQKPTGASKDAKWYVPITFLSTNAAEPTKPVFWLTKEKDTMKKPNNSNWLMLNALSTGFYRVQYDSKTLDKIIAELKSENREKIPAINRAAFIDDLLNLAKAGKLDYQVAFKGLQYLRKEKDYLPIKAAFNALDHLIRKFTSSDLDREMFENFAMSLISDTYHELTFDDQEKDDHLKILLRQELNNRACALGNQECIIKSQKYFQNWKNTTKTIVPKNQRSAVYPTAIKYGTDKDWEFLWKEYSESKVAHEQITILNALGYSNNTEILEKYLKNALLKPYKESLIRKQDLSTVINGIASSAENAYFLAEFVFHNYEELKSKLPKKTDESEGEIISLLTTALQKYPTKKLIAKVESIVREWKITGKALESLKTSLKSANSEVDWSDKYLNPLKNLIKSEKDSESKTSIGNTVMYRLSKDIKPKFYKLYLEPNLDKAIFKGIVEIIASVENECEKIVLHSDQLDFKKEDITIYDETDKSKAIPVPIFSLSYSKKYQFTYIDLGIHLKKGSEIRIKINYKGILNTEMRGFYISYYPVQTGNSTKVTQRAMAATHFEPTGARRMFPCFDEPALKARFNISVLVPDKMYKAISNMPVQKNDNYLYTFEQTPVMSTYLIAVMVSDFDFKTGDPKDKYKYTVYANPRVSHQLSYSLSVMKPTIEVFEKNLNISYGLPKLDMIALPDFSSGAMENWGLITYRETGMLYDEKQMSTIANKQSIRNVICHEITHQWFGNLVSPEWWSYLWLSEGFARYFQYFAHSSSEDSWDLENQFVVEALQSSMVSDATTSTHPVTSEVWSPKEIKGIFDSVSYAKAASLIRMVEHLLGEKSFYNALNKYLSASGTNHATGTPDKLFKAFQDETSIADFPVVRVMNSWTNYSGYPVVTANFNGKLVTLKQTRFFLRLSKEKIPSKPWSLPIRYITNVKNDTLKQKVQWIHTGEGTVSIPEAEKGWVILNPLQTGYYRVNYDKITWNKIVKALNDPKDRELIPYVTRAVLIDDLMNLGRAGLVEYSVVFSGLSYLQHEKNYVPWKAFFNNVPYLTRRFEGRPESYELYKKFLISLLEPSFKNLGIGPKPDGHTDSLLRNLVLSWLCRLDYKDCVSKAKELFTNELNKSQIVPPSQRGFAYCTGIRTGDDKQFKQMQTKFKNSIYATEKMTILSALSCSKDAKLLKGLLQDAITKYPESEIRFQDAKNVFTNVINASPEGTKATSEFIVENYDKIQKYFNDPSIIQNMISTISKRISTKNQLKELEDFEKNLLQKLPDLKETFTSAKNRANNELKWYEDNAGKIFKFLRSQPINLPINHRLEITARPMAYDIHIDPYFEERNFTFDGVVTIDMTVEKDTFEIILHANDIEIVSIEDKSKKYLGLTSVMEPKTQKMFIFFNTLVPAGTKLSLVIKYKGHLRDDMKGFYRSSYVDADNKIRWIASTQFEPTHARRAFPCFDEPMFKATFTMHISKPNANYSTLSNMAYTKKEEQASGNKRAVDHYEKSVVMSPYVLAFIVSDFVSAPEKPTTVQVWARKQLEKYMKDAAVLGEETLEILNGYTLVPYPLRKMNLVAIPDFSAGAMENWGLVTFREYGLSYNNTSISASYRRYVVTTVAHELVHMWFGNLVTCDWWDYTWLNEGFAEYLSFLVGDQLRPDWQLLKQFVVLDLHTALDTDSSETSHPMNNKVTTPSEAQGGFDNIAYKKAGSVLRMLRDSFGRAIFQESLHNYLDTHKFKTAKPEGLIAAFQERANFYERLPGGLDPKKVTEIWNSWADHSGYPVITATRNNNTVTLTQERFVLSPSNSSVKERYYYVPITYTTESLHNFEDTKPKLWLPDKNKVTFNVASNDTWYILNIQEIGFYRVNYDENNWKRLIAVLNSDKYTVIGELNRAQIIDDSFALARAGYIGYDVPLNISMYLNRETSHLPWKAFFSAIGYLGRRIEGDDQVKELYAQHITNLLSQEVAKTEYKEDLAKDHLLNQLNKELLLTHACKNGHKDCETKAKEYFKKPETITPNIAYPIYCAAIEKGNQTEWDTLWAKYKGALLASDYITMLKALGCSRRDSVLKKYLDHIIEKNSAIRKQDVGTAFSSIYSSSQEGLNTAFDFYQSNLVKLKDYFGSWEDVGALFTGLAGYITTPDQIKKLEALKERKDAAEIKKSLESAIKSANKNIEWYKGKSKQVNEWFSSHYKPKDKGGKNSATAPTLSLTFIVCISLAHFFLQ